MYGVNELKLLDGKIIELDNLLAKGNLNATEITKVAELRSENLKKQRRDLAQAAITQAGGREDIVDLVR
jgi:hypothetical protein